MKKTLISLFAVALFVPAMAMAAPGHHPGSNHNPGYNNGNNHSNPPVAYPGNGFPGHKPPVYNNGNGSNNNNSNNNGSYNHGNNNGNSNNNGSYNHGNNNNNHGGFNNPGHGGFTGHDNHGPAVGKEMMMTHHSIARAFRDAENSYYPFLMNNEDKRKMGMAIRRLSGELSNLMSMVDRRYRDEVREIGMTVDRARFTLVSENSAKEAHRMMQRAEMQYNRLAERLFRRRA